MRFKSVVVLAITVITLLMVGGMLMKAEGPPVYQQAPEKAMEPVQVRGTHMALVTQITRMSAVHIGDLVYQYDDLSYEVLTNAGGDPALLQLNYMRGRESTKVGVLRWDPKKETWHRLNAIVDIEEGRMPYLWVPVFRVKEADSADLPAGSLIMTHRRGATRVLKDGRYYDLNLWNPLLLEEGP